MPKEITEADFAAAQSVIDSGGIASIAGRTAVSSEELKFIRAAVQGEKSAELPPRSQGEFTTESPSPVPEVEMLTQPLTDAEMMAEAAGDVSNASPKAKAASKSQAQAGMQDGNADAVTGPTDGAIADASTEPTSVTIK